MAFISKKTGSTQKGPLLGGQASLMKLKGSFKGFSSAKNSPLLGGEDSLAKLRESFKKPRQAKEIKKEVKKDTSLFQGKQYLTRPEISRLFKKDWAWKITRLPANIRSKLGEKLWDRKTYGIYVDPREAKKVSKDFEDYPNRARSKYGIKSRSEVIKTRNLLRKFIGK